MRTVIACLLLVVLHPLASAGEDQAKTDKLAALQGTWKVKALEFDGKPSDLPEVSFWWVIQGDKVFYGGQELAKLTVDAATKPPCIDLAFRNPDRVYEAIYAVEADTLKICVNRATEGVKERPSSFSTEGKPGWRLLVFSKDKDRKT